MQATSGLPLAKDDSWQQMGGSMRPTGRSSRIDLAVALPLQGLDTEEMCVDLWT
jgi:hypothetical protein